MQFRIFRYRESYASETAEQLFDREFEHEEDPTLSVYSIEESDACEIQLEHKAGARADPPRGGWGVDVALIGRSMTHDDPGGYFSLRRRTHHVLDLVDLGEVRELSDALFHEIQNGLAHIEHSKAELRLHLRDRIARGDDEWTAFLARASKAWKKMAGIT